MTSAAACHVFSAGFSFHRKPFHSSLNEGLQNYLLRLQTEGRSRTRIDGVISTVETGDLMLFAPDDPYYLSIDKENYPVGKPRIESGDYHIFCGGLDRGMVDTQTASCPSPLAAQRLFSWLIPPACAGAAQALRLLTRDFSVLSADFMYGD